MLVGSLDQVLRRCFGLAALRQASGRREGGEVSRNLLEGACVMNRANPHSFGLPPDGLELAEKGHLRDD